MVVLSLLATLLHWNNFWARACGLVLTIMAARLSARIICPIAAIVFKWIVIGKYKPGEYEMYVFAMSCIVHTDSSSTGGAHIIFDGG